MTFERDDPEVDDRSRITYEAHEDISSLRTTLRHTIGGSAKLKCCIAPLEARLPRKHSMPSDDGPNLAAAVSLSKTHQPYTTEHP